MWTCLLRNICFFALIPESAHHSNAAIVRTGDPFEYTHVRTKSASRETTFFVSRIRFFFMSKLFCIRSAIVDRRHFVQLSTRRHFVQLSACRHRTFERRSHLRPKRARRSNACATRVKRFIRGLTWGWLQFASRHKPRTALMNHFSGLESAIQCAGFSFSWAWIRRSRCWKFFDLPLHRRSPETP